MSWWQSFQEFWQYTLVSSLAFLTSQQGHVVVLVLGLGIAVVSWWQLRLQTQLTTQACPSCPSCLVGWQEVLSLASPSSQVKASQFWVDVSGAVVHPGIYQLPATSRWADAIQLAGGLSPQADTAYVAAKLNLTTPIQSNDKIYIPPILPTGLEITPSVIPSSIGTGLIDLNTASVTELETLPGIGSVTAQKIVANRPYQTLVELLEREVVSQTLYNKIVELVTIAY